MGIARGRFVVDTHVHAQRHAAKFRERGIKPDFLALAKEMSLMGTYDNSARLLYDMERYGVDMCVLQPAFGMSNELNAELVKKYPDKFVAMCNAVETRNKALRGEAEWTAEAAAKEIDELLGTGLYQAGIGEGIPCNPAPKKVITWPERFDEICQIMDVAQKHKVLVSYHTGTISGYAGTGFLSRNVAPDWADPMLAYEIKCKYTDVPLIMAHGGMQGWWSEKYIDDTLQVAASFDNVYIETGMYWAELYEKPLADPNIGVEKLIWGTDWGASDFVYTRLGQYPSTYVDQVRRWGLPGHQSDLMGWSLRQLDKLDVSQDDLNLILGGNAVRLFKLKVPFTRLFREYSE